MHVETFLSTYEFDLPKCDYPEIFRYLARAYLRPLPDKVDSKHYLVEPLHSVSLIQRAQWSVSVAPSAPQSVKISPCYPV